MADKKTKQSAEILDFDFIADKRLTNNDQIINVTAAFTGPDSALVIERTTWTTNVAKVWLSGGTNGVTYEVTATIYTFNGRKMEGQFMLLVRDQ